jgi:hypothetical protein
VDRAPLVLIDFLTVRASLLFDENDTPDHEALPEIIRVFSNPKHPDQLLRGQGLDLSTI